MTDNTTTGLDRAGSRIDHLNIAVPDLGTAVRFYEPVLASIGVAKMLEIPSYPDERGVAQPAMTGFGLADVKPWLWLVADGTVGTNMHLALTVETRDDVRSFHAAALAAGATSRDEPGVFPRYHPDYFGAFVTDPHGINLEAVCHRPEA
jgi:catechol 2,3-dioxygenase-like lactoylglutathione lyase family enzyme